MPLLSSSLAQIRTQFAQAALSAALLNSTVMLDDKFGMVVTDADDINQAIHIILGTPKGSDPHRPLFGSDWYHWIDSPINLARPHIVREVVDALTRWEPRIELVRVMLTQTDKNNFATKTLLVEWRFAKGVAEQIFSSNIALADLMTTLSGVVQ